MGHSIESLLKDLGISPVLVDIGASGEPPPIWDVLAPSSTYIGFDPDLREIHENRLSRYHASVILNEAVTERAGVSEIPFYLTTSPFCSTTLGPNPSATAHWLERDKFVVETETTLRATTIDSVLKRRNLSTIHWIKLDTQGTDLRVIRSIPPDVFAKIMAIDTEPGLIDIYQGEDMFVEVHRDLTSKGFWLSSFHTGAFLRMRRTTLDAARQQNPAVDEAYIRRSVRPTPAYFEARYLRTLEWLADHRASQSDYLMLWIFTLVDEQFGFALDLNAEMERLFGKTEQARKLEAATWQFIQRAHRLAGRHRVLNGLTRRLRSAVDRLLGA